MPKNATARAMSSLVYYLAKHPEFQKRARREAQVAVGNADPSVYNLRGTPFIQACVRECLRLSTPVVRSRFGPDSTPAKN